MFLVLVVVMIVFFVVVMLEWLGRFVTVVMVAVVVIVVMAMVVVGDQSNPRFITPISDLLLTYRLVVRRPTTKSGLLSHSNVVV